MMTEIWKDVVGYEGVYEVSNMGRVRRVGGKVLAQNPKNQHGHLGVTLCSVGRKQRYVYVHKLVAEAFIGPRPDGHIILHGPAGEGDNSVSNIRYGTYAENHRDMIEFGRPNFTVRKVKFSDEAIEGFSSLARIGKTTREIGAIYGADHGYVAKVLRGIHRKRARRH